MHCHYEYSNERLKDSTNRVDDVLMQCHKFGIRTLAISDHDILTGHVQFLQKTEAFNKDHPNETIKPVLGNEVYIVDDNNAAAKSEGHYPGRIYGHLILLAKNANGYRQIKELSKIAWGNGFYRGRNFTTPIDFNDLQSVVHKGDIICSTACLGSLFAKYIAKMFDAKQAGELETVKAYGNKINDYVKQYRDLFGDDFYIEIQPNEKGTLQWQYNKLAIAIAEKHNVKYVITTDCHYLRPENAKDHEIFLKSQEDDHREVSDFYNYTYLMSDEEIHQLMDENIGREKVCTALENTLTIAEQIEVYSLKQPVHMPVVDLPEDLTRKGVFEKYCEGNWDLYPGIKFFIDSDNEYNKTLLFYIEQGLISKVIRHSKKKNKLKRYVQEINKNLEVLQDFEVNHGSNYSQYFLVTKKIIDLVWDAGSFVGVARGSAGAFIINYLMEIVDVDAIEANFPYWRFLAIGRNDEPDIDMDFSPLYKSRIMNAITSYFGLDKVLPISTVGTEGSKSAILSSARAFGVDVDIAQHISNAIPIDRGNNWPIRDCIEGNAAKDREPIPLMQKYYKQYTEMLDAAMRIEGLINKRSTHASGVLIYPDNYLEYNSMMVSPGGGEVSAYTMEDSQYCGGIKQDLLFTEYESKLQLCLELMRKDGLIQGDTAKELYQFITPDNLNLEDMEIWENIFHKGNVKEIFQMEGTVGVEIVKKIKPSNISELSAANSLMRLKSDINVELIGSQSGFSDIPVTDFMKDLFEKEQLSDKYLRYKNAPQEFIGDTVRFGVPEEWARKIQTVLSDTYGVCVTQEDLMLLCMNIFGFNIVEAHKARKGVAKKKGKLIEDCRLLIVKKAVMAGIPSIVAFYVWLLIMGTAAYSFSVVHAYSYSLIGYQGAFLKYYYPLYWNTACLTINAQATDTEEDAGEDGKKKNKTTDYAKVAKAIFDLQQDGVTVHTPDINKSEMGFSVDSESNTILFGLKPLDGVSDDVSAQILELAPYQSFQEFMDKHILFDAEQYPERRKLNKSTMLALIFSDAFATLGVRRSECVVKYMLTQISAVETLSTRYLEELQKNGILPSEFDTFIHMKNWMPKIKKYQHEDKKTWKIPHTESEIIQHIYDHYLDSVESDTGMEILLTKKTVNAAYKEHEQAVKSWLENNNAAVLAKINQIRVKQEYKEWTKGKSAGDLAFKAMGMYIGESWLDTAAEKYGISEYLSLPRADDNIVGWGKYKGQEYPLFGICQIPIAVIDKNTKHKTITGYTKGTIITLRLKPESFDYYSSLFVRGEKLIVWGYRGNKDDTFTVKLYNSVRKNYSETHTVMRVEG